LWPLSELWLREPLDSLPPESVLLESAGHSPLRPASSLRPIEGL